MFRSRRNSKSLGNHVVSPEEEKERLQLEGFAEKEGFKSGMKERVGNGKLTRSSAIAKGPRDASCQFKSFQLPRNSAETTCTTSTETDRSYKVGRLQWVSV